MIHVDPKWPGLVLLTVLVIANVWLVIRHQRLHSSMRWKHLMSLYRVQQASRQNSPAPVHELMSAVIDEEMDRT